MKISEEAKQATTRIWDRFNIRWPQADRDIFNHHIQYAIDRAKQTEVIDRAKQIDRECKEKAGWINIFGD